MIISPMYILLFSIYMKVQINHSYYKEHQYQFVCMYRSFYS
ncbi:hypothetical protein M093_2287 [Bacteroides uniformis str. 3978 T3 i]|uniref:Uncharacterized protein n=2 Tax=Bacteroides uniformis TaxID=820 RepID=A0A078S1S9_BACUN|nr:hypothetical protein BACUNI_04595 [Bacteroides uniformis ATCC 8492]KDS50616.1 hypothetical protein M094_1547 [Bacteroides uniformis str. 3978 T3 ii]KDS60283.1 hypothetical protein M093_2287 [Bacteroides uniformis str. 3978 T3 i]